MKRFWWPLFVLAWLGFTLGAQAQTFPDKPLTIIVPYGPGGLSDQLARELASHMSRTMKQSVIVDNRAGGGAQIAMNALKQLPADGYTMVLADFGPLALNTSLFSKLSYDTRKDLQPVTQLVTAPALLVVPKSSPYKTAQQLFDAAKTKGGLNYASPGVGSGGHLFGTMLGKKLGTPLTHIAYRGSAPGLIDVMAGQVDFMYDAISSSGVYVASDKITALAIGADRRSPIFPQVPTLKELGWDSIVSKPWFGIVVKSGTPAPVVDRLNSELIGAMHDPIISKKFLDQGLEIMTSTPAEFGAYIASETDRWGKVIREADMKVD